MSISLHQFLTIYTWFAISAFVFLLALIARFYERLSGAHTHYRWFFLPVIALAGSTVQFSGGNRMAGDVLGDSLLFVGGVGLTVLCIHIYRLMTSGGR